VLFKEDEIAYHLKTVKQKLIFVLLEQQSFQWFRWGIQLSKELHPVSFFSKSRLN
jgi:hypothetical protein